MLIELKRKALEAHKTHCKTQDRVLEWENIFDCSDNLAKFLDLDIGEESKKFINKMVDINVALNLAYDQSKEKSDELALDYALKKLGGKRGDILDYIDINGKERAIVVKDAHLISGGDVAVTGTRFLKSGRIGRFGDYVYLDTFSWKLRGSNSSNLE